jgi:hypothetical protein
VWRCQDQSGGLDEANRAAPTAALRLGEDGARPWTLAAGARCWGTVSCASLTFRKPAHSPWSIR